MLRNEGASARVANELLFLLFISYIVVEVSLTLVAQAIVEQDAGALVESTVLERGIDLFLGAHVGFVEDEAVVAYLGENGHNHITQLLVANILIVLNDVIQEVTQLNELESALNNIGQTRFHELLEILDVLGIFLFLRIQYLSGLLFVAVEALLFFWGELV